MRREEGAPARRTRQRLERGEAGETANAGTRTNRAYEPKAGQSPSSTPLAAAAVTIGHYLNLATRRTSTPRPPGTPVDQHRWRAEGERGRRGSSRHRGSPRTVPPRLNASVESRQTPWPNDAATYEMCGWVVGTPKHEPCLSARAEATLHAFDAPATRPGLAERR